METTSDRQDPSEPSSGATSLLREAWIIVNPGARQGRRGESIRQIFIEQEQTGAQWRIRVSMRPGHGEALAAQAVESGARLILAAGGDGALHEVVNAVMRFEPSRRPVLSVIPLGSGNDFAKMLGVPRGVEPALAALRSGVVAPVDLGRAGGRWFVNDLGFGLLSEAARIYHRLPRAIGGSVRYCAAALWAAAANWTGRARISADGKSRFDGPFSMLAVSNGGWTGGRFRVNPAAAIDDGLLDVCLARPVARWQALGNLPRLLCGGHVSHPAVETFCAASVRIESEDLKLYQMDGELHDFPREGLDIVVRPKAIDFLLPPPPPAKA